MVQRAGRGGSSATMPRRVTLRVLVVDDHEVLRNGLRWLLTRVPWVERCAGARSADEALRGRARSTSRSSTSASAADVRARLERHRRADTALLTSRWDLVPMRTARAAGARGVIAKDRPARELLAAVRELAAGGGCEPEPAAPAGEVRFVPREREILRLVGAGLTNAEIGAALFLAPGTIKHHMLGLYDKLGAPNRAAAVHAARRLGVLADRARAVRAHRSEPAARAGRRPRRRPPRRRPARPARPRVGARPCAGARTLADARCDGRRAAATRSSSLAGSHGVRAAGRSRRVACCARTATIAPAGRGPRRRRRRLPARARRAVRVRGRRHQPGDRARRSGSPPTRSSSTPPRSSASSACATAPRPSRGPTSSGCWPRSGQQPSP